MNTLTAEQRDRNSVSITEYKYTVNIGDNHIKITGQLYLKLAWEPSAAKVTKSYSRRIPEIKRFYRETKFSPLKPTHST